MAFYKILLEDFFESPKGYKKVTINDDRLLVKPITSDISLSNPSRVINLVQPADYDKDYLEQYLLGHYRTLWKWRNLSEKSLMKLWKIQSKRIKLSIFCLYNISHYESGQLQCAQNSK